MSEELTPRPRALDYQMQLCYGSFVVGFIALIAILNDYKDFGAALNHLVDAINVSIYVIMLLWFRRARLKKPEDTNPRFLNWAMLAVVFFIYGSLLFQLDLNRLLNRLGGAFVCCAAIVMGWSLYLVITYPARAQRLLEKFNERAGEIMRSRDLTWPEKDAELDKLPEELKKALSKL